MIHNLPFNVDVKEDQTAELELYVINATDSSQFDTVTCSIQSVSPVTSIFLTKISIYYHDFCGTNPQDRQANTEK